jgi:hypothetical protein
MATAEHREPYESRGSRTVLGAPGGEIPPGDSTKPEILKVSKSCPLYLLTHRVGSSENPSAPAVLRFDEAQTRHDEEISMQSGIDGQHRYYEPECREAMTQDTSHNREQNQMGSVREGERVLG